MKSAPLRAYAPACRFVRYVGPRLFGLWASTALAACASLGSGGSTAPPGAAHGAGSGKHGTAGGVLPPSLAAPPPAAPESLGPLLPELTRTRLRNGSEIHVLHRPTARLASLRVVLRAPLTNAAERRVARWALASLLHGATQKDRDALDVFGSKPQVILPMDGVDGAQIAWSVLPGQLEAALEWLAGRLTNPRLTDFDAVAWQLDQRQLQRLRTEPSYLASYLSTAPMPAGGPAQLRLQAPHPALQSPRSFECQRWLLQALHPDQAHFVLVGPVDAPHAESLVRSSFGDWSTSTKATPTSSAQVAAAPPGRPHQLSQPSHHSSLRLAHVEDSAWTHLRFSFAGPVNRGASSRANGGDERSWAQLQWGLQLLRSSESLQRVARDLGVTQPTLTATAHGDAWQIHLDVAAPGEKTLELTSGVHEALARVAEAGFSAREVARAVDTERARVRHALQDQELLATLLATFVGARFEPRIVSEELNPPAGELGSVTQRLNANWQLSDALEELDVTVVGDAKRLEKALSTWRPVLVFDPKRDLRLLRRVAHDPEAPRDISASATEEDAPGS